MAMEVREDEAVEHHGVAPPGDEATAPFRRIEVAIGAAAAVLVAGLVIGATMFGGADADPTDAETDQVGLDGADPDPLQAVRVGADAEASGAGDQDADEAIDQAGDGNTEEGDDSTSDDASDGEAGSVAPASETSVPTSTDDADTPNPDGSDDAAGTDPTATTVASNGSAQPTTTPTTPTTTASAPQLASPDLEPLVPAFADSAADPDGQVQLTVGWEAVPGATRYQNVFSVDGVELGRPSTQGTADRPVAIAWFQGKPGRQYCLQVVAYSDTQPASEPSVVCSVEASPMDITIGTVANGATSFGVSWTAVEPAARYEVLAGWNGRTAEAVTLTSETRTSIDLNGRTGQACVILRALDSGGSRLQSAVRCAQVS